MRPKWLRVGILSLAMVVVGMASFGEGVRGKFVPPPGKILFLVGQDKPSLDQYVSATGVVPGGTMVYTSIQKLEGLFSKADAGGGIHHGDYLLKAYPHSVVQIGLYMVGALPEVVRGQYDVHLDALGQWIQKADRPVFLRIGYEFDLPQNRYDPKLYVQAYQHVVDRLRTKGVSNAAFVWHSYANLPAHPWTDWYPGDDYVDWFGISLFERPNVYMKKFAEIARQHGKPFMIAESTPQRIGTSHGAASWEYWFSKFFQFIAENDVKAVCYINYHWDLIPMFKGWGWGDARVQANGEVKRRWLAEIRRDIYLQASPELFQILGHVSSGKEKR